METGTIVLIAAVILYVGAFIIAITGKDKNN